MSEHVEVVIKIPKYYLTHPQDYTCLAECVRRGVLLPKGHGRLIDADRLLKYERIDIYTDFGWESKVSGLSIECAPTIIEADKEEE